MRNLLRADFYRMFRTRRLWLYAGLMAIVAIALMAIQRTAMDYTVSLDRVLFLPMAFYGIAAAALVAGFLGDDFADGVFKNKIICGQSKTAVYLSAQAACWAGCAAVYLLTTTLTVCAGPMLFPVNVSGLEIARYALLGICTALAYGSVFCLVAMLCQNKSTALTLCMALAFGMLFACLHTNQVLTQSEWKNGLPNPAYAHGFKRTLYLFLHDLNPSGQAAQLSAMNCLCPVRFLAVDLGWILFSVFAGARLFERVNGK